MGTRTDIHEQAITRVLEHMMADGRDETLFGEGPERALDSYCRFKTARNKPCVLIELPLLGEPSYDVLVGLYADQFAPGDTLADTNQRAAQAAVDWAASYRAERRIDLLFELDADADGPRHPGMHCRHKGQLDAADAFFEAIGEAWRAPLHRAVAERASGEWRCEYAAVFPSRDSQLTRIELQLKGEARERAAGNPDHVRACFDAIGFTAYDQAMLAQVAELAKMRPLHTLQFDIRADGTLGDTFSLASYFEGEGSAMRHMFGEGGSGTAVCRAYEDLGIADGRWHELAGALLATKGSTFTGSGMRRFCSLAVPCCAKAKWTCAHLVAGKFYLTAAVI